MSLKFWRWALCDIIFLFFLNRAECFFIRVDFVDNFVDKIAFMIVLVRMNDGFCSFAVAFAQKRKPKFTGV
jgi:hypothetical protein